MTEQIGTAELRQRLAAAIARVCRLDPSEVDVDRPLIEYGLTSREAVQLAGELADVLDRDLPATLVWQHSSISALVTALLDEPAGAAEAVLAITGEPIAVVGIGCRLPGDVGSPADLWELLLDGGNAVTSVPEGRWEQFGHESPEQAEKLARTTRWGGFLSDVTGFDADFFGITPREAAVADPQQRLLLEVTQEALDHAGIAADRLRGTRTGVFVGISGNEYSRLTLGDVSRVDPWTATGASLSVAANRLSYVFDLRGPSIAVDTACSSSLVAVHLAMQSLRSGESNLALVGGANLLLGPGVTATFDQMGVLAADGLCKAFDAAADGIGRAEGAAVVVLKPLAAALRDQDRVLAVLRGSAVNSDGRSNGLTAPNPEAQEALLRSAYASAEVDPADVDYVEAHGTGTLLGDPIEAGALGAVLGQAPGREQPLLIGSVKTNLGHLEAAAGIAGLIKVVLSLAHQRLPASLHFREANPHIPFERLRLAVASGQRLWPGHGRPAVAGVSGFGFGGTNAHVVVEQPPDIERRGRMNNRGQFLLAGNTQARVRQAADRLADWLTGHGDQADLADVEHTLARRASGRARAVVTAKDRQQLVSGLRSLAAGTTAPGVALGQRGRAGNGTVWVFSGQGAQWAGMGQRLLIDEPAFAEAVAEIDEAGIRLYDVLAEGYVPEAFAELQPVLFGLQVALARLWQHYGAQPAAVIGHSLGEVAAAVVAGAVSLADGVRIVKTRSRLLATTAGTGAMAMLEMSAQDVSALLAGYPAVDLAVFNAPRQTVVAGPVSEVLEVVAEATKRGVATGLIKSTVAGHSRLVEPITEALRAELSSIEVMDPVIPIYPTAAADGRFDADYWVSNVRRPVRFAQAVDAAYQDGYRTFVEISAHPLLRHAISETVRGATVLGTLRRDEPGSFQANLGALIADSDQPPRTSGRLIDLPATAWDHTQHWVPPISVAPAGDHPLLGTHCEIPQQDVHLWRGDLGTLRHPWLADHRIDGIAVLSGACYVEMAFAAAATVLDRPAEKLGLRSVTLHQPLPLTEHTWVTTTCSRDEVLFHTKGPDGRWILHCSALITDADGTEWHPSDQCGEPVTDLYDRLRSYGIDYGPAFKSVTEASQGESTAVVTVSVPEAAPQAGYVIHPALLDACLQGIVAAAPPAETDVRYVPMEFGQVRLLGDPRSGERAYVSLAPEDSGLTSEVRLVDADGQVLVEITGVFLRKVTHSPFAAPLRESLLARRWQPVDVPGSAESGPVLLVAEPDHPLAAAAVSAIGPQCRLVSTVDFEALERERPSTVALLVPPDRSDGLETGKWAVLDCAEWVRALTELPGKPPRLWLVTTYAATVAPGDQGQPGPASVRGLVRVLSYEHPSLRVGWLDVSSAADLAAELTAGAADDEVAWREGQRYVARLSAATVPAPAVPVVRPDGGYVITGGLGGLGLMLAGWLAGRGAARLVLNGRKQPGPAAVAVIEELRSAGTSVEVVLGDVAEPGVAERLLAAAGTPRGIAHAAAVFDDRPVALLDDETLRRTWWPKADGAWRLHTASLDHDLDWWLGFSSATALHGLPGQPAYASANAYLDALVALRQANGLPGAVVNWGTWAEVGAAADIDVPWIHPIQPAEGLEVIEDVIAARGAQVAAVRLNTSRLVQEFPDLADIPFFSEVLAQHKVVESDEWPGIAAVRKSPEARRLVADQVRFRVASVMGLDTEALADDLPLPSLGVDSLLAMRIRNALQHDLEINLPVSLLLAGATLTQLCARVFTEVGILHTEDNSESPVLVPPRDAAERLVTSAWQDVLGTPVGVTQEFPGDEDQAAQIAALLSERAAHEFDTAELFARPTIELMANHVRAADRATGPVRVLRDGSEPLFFFHPGGGDTAVFRQLVDLLDAPAYGFDRIDDTTTVEERAERFLPSLRAIQPTGPYRLAGWSFGGFLAFEMAQRLSAAGETVDLLALIDPILPLPEEPGLAETDRLERRFRRFGEFLETSYGKRVGLPYADLAALSEEEQADLLIATIVSAGLINEQVSAAILAHQRSSFLDARLLERYQPEPYAGPVIFYSAESAVPGGLRDQRFDRCDPARGWDSVCDNLEIVTVPGHHLSLLDPPNVNVIAEHLTGVLRRRNLGGR
ncbi:phthiocerol/phenolphthiocerol synthesis type-I polyketide synthase D [Kibdelosporangium banguiense]|uniref:Phthiocerol/phenolphthiocerol synthesis type-I polyketide synthase D n=1 Tax=Kibdelosporangium banguiense TaxID=1365924 RepID=A0ABS4TNW2_9PSEU|nr:type I polyketide synthase [Kibdelosporangium banguiense]MBP2326086.1 phthiocerol/phenolphthiocerol synthesis type-I polyketide synthase D [Kibdelosporangium banguiense]